MRTTVVLAASLLSTAALAQPVVAEAPLRAHLSFLADDLLEGRGTGQRGGDLAVRYLETQAAVAGLQPVSYTHLTLPTMVSAWRYVPSFNGCRPATAACVSR